MIRDCLRDLSTLAHLQHLEIPKLQQYHLPRSPAQNSMPDSEGLYAASSKPLASHRFSIWTSVVGIAFAASLSGICWRPDRI